MTGLQNFKISPTVIVHAFQSLLPKSTPEQRALRREQELADVDTYTDTHVMPGKKMLYDLKCNRGRHKGITVTVLATGDTKTMIFCKATRLYTVSPSYKVWLYDPDTKEVFDEDDHQSLSKRFAYEDPYPDPI